MAIPAPTRRDHRWDVEITHERNNIADREEGNETLLADGKGMVRDAYRDAVREAAKETGLARNAFPFDCPYSVEQIRDFDWMPGELCTENKGCT